MFSNDYTQASIAAHLLEKTAKDQLLDHPTFNAWVRLLVSHLDKQPSPDDIALIAEFGSWCATFGLCQERQNAKTVSPIIVLDKRKNIPLN